MDNYDGPQSPLACDMSGLLPRQREEHLADSRELLSQIQQIRDLTNGYEFQLPADSKMIRKAVDFIVLEKLCCPFLHFMLELEAERGPLWLRLTGREGVKDFIREEISGLLGGVIDWK